MSAARTDDGTYDCADDRTEAVPNARYLHLMLG